MHRAQLPAVATPCPLSVEIRRDRAESALEPGARTAASAAAQRPLQHAQLVTGGVDAGDPLAAPLRLAWLTARDDQVEHGFDAPGDIDVALTAGRLERLEKDMADTALGAIAHGRGPPSWQNLNEQRCRSSHGRLNQR